MKKLIIIFLLFTSSIKCFSQWALDSFPCERAYFQAVTFNDKVYFIAGQWGHDLCNTQLTSEVSVYNCITSTWDSSTFISLARDYPACVSGDSGIYVFGGRTSDVYGESVDYGTNVVDIYKNGSWQTRTVDDSVWGGIGIKVGSKLMFTGFVDSINNITKEIFASKKVWIYDEVMESWSVDSLSSPRWQLGAASNGTIAIFAGGVNGLGITSDVVDIYNSVTNTWTTSHLSVSRCYLGATYTNGKFYFAGGIEGGVVSNPSDVVDVYDGNNWTTNQLSEPRGGINAVTVGDKAYFMAGGKMDLSLLYFDVSVPPPIYYDHISPVDVLNTTDGTWSRKDLNYDLTDIASTTWGNKIFVGGGQGSVPTWFFGMQLFFYRSKYVQILDVTVGISEISNEISFDVYPNPSTGPFTILLPEINAEIIITDVLGNVIMKTKAMNRKLDLQLYNDGMYFVNVKTKHGSATGKIFVNGN